jgi:hypothetical protein
MKTNAQIANVLRTSAAADIWYDAGSHGDDAAQATIDAAKEAMEDAAAILSAPHSPGRTRAFFSGDPTNDDRAAWAEEAIQAFERATGTDREDSVSDLLCNLMHFCNLNGLDFLAELNRGAGHYQAEVEIEETEEQGEDVDPSQVAENPHHYVRCEGFAPLAAAVGMEGEANAR